MTTSVHDIPDYIRSKTHYLDHGKCLSMKYQWWNWVLHNAVKTVLLKKYTHEIDAGTFMKYTVCTTLTDGNCCHISPGFMIQVKYLASVVSPVCCCNTGDLEDTRRQADQWLTAVKNLIFLKYFKEFCLGATKMFVWYSKGSLRSAPGGSSHPGHLQALSNKTFRCRFASPRWLQKTKWDTSKRSNHPLDGSLATSAPLPLIRGQVLLLCGLAFPPLSVDERDMAPLTCVKESVRSIHGAKYPAVLSLTPALGTYVDKSA